jgi:GH15 family glucan-1,4-alpha-glucosidase
MIQKKIKELIKSSKKVIKDCSLENGAIVAANVDKPYFHREAANYRWVWPRDASFVCVAADILNIPIQEPFFSWLEKFPQDFQKNKILYSNYATNGRVGSMGRFFQPDQAGEALWAIYWHFQDDLEKSLKYKELISRLADGICRYWDKTHFSRHTVDIWEESHRHTSVTMQNNFTYSLAACSKGLLLAHQIQPISLWKETALQMIEQIEKAYDSERNYFYRTAGKINDTNIDASLLGLIWPFEIIEAQSRKAGCY